MITKAGRLDVGDHVSAHVEATFSDDEAHRYLLKFTWDDRKPIGAFIALNPSTASHLKTDHTIVKDAGFATRWGWGGFVKANLFAFRTTWPKELWKATDPVGPYNDSFLRSLRGGTDRVVAAWGTQSKPVFRQRVWHVLNNVLADCRLFSIGDLTKDGSPPHPLMLGYERTLKEWR